MAKRTTIEIDDELLKRAQRALGGPTMRATIEEALRRATGSAEEVARQRAEAQRRYLEKLPSRADLGVLNSEVMWR